MDDFRIDAELHETLRNVRESVRAMFEQLRLRDEDGDISGKERLERVPALAKRNFGNLVSQDTQLAIREAWRLVDFLEGREKARLTPLAREALRAIELDSSLARLRNSDCWKEAAAGLRKALGASKIDAQNSGGSAPSAGVSDPGPPAAVVTETLQEAPADAAAEGAIPPPLLRRWQRPLIGALTGATILGGFTAWAVLANGEDRLDPRVACLPLERASERERAAHWTIAPRASVPLPRRGPTRTNPMTFIISDPDNGPVRSIFTTSQFSYEEVTGRTGIGGKEAPLAATGGPGGGKADDTLRVGGWGDTYLSLLKFPLPDNRTVRRAALRLVVRHPTSRPTAMVLRVIRDAWSVEAGPQHRLWWRDCPRSDAFVRLPAPGTPETPYEINITDIYNLWALGLIPNHGIMLEPEQIGSWGSSAEHYPNISTFYSTRAIDPEKRPKLILTY